MLDAQEVATRARRGRESMRVSLRIWYIEHASPLLRPKLTRPLSTPDARHTREEPGSLRKLRGAWRGMEGVPVS